MLFGRRSLSGIHILFYKVPYSGIFSRVQNFAESKQRLLELYFAVFNFKTLNYVNRASVDFLTHHTVALTSRFTLEVGLPVSRVLSRAS